KNSHFLLTIGRNAFKAGDLDQAEHLAKQASDGASMVAFLWGDSPSKLLKEIHEARKKGAPNPPPVPPGGEANEVGGRMPSAGSGSLAAKQAEAAAHACG